MLVFTGVTFWTHRIKVWKMMFLFKQVIFRFHIKKSRVCPGSVKNLPQIVQLTMLLKHLDSMLSLHKTKLAVSKFPISAQTTLQETSLEVTNNPLKRSRHVFTVPKKLTSMNHQAWRVQQKTRHGVFSNEKVATFLTKKSPEKGNLQFPKLKSTHVNMSFIYTCMYLITTI